MFSPAINRKWLGGQLVWGLSWVILTSFGLFLHPNRYGHGTHQQLGLPPCPSVMFFDRPCPGCGLTTSWTNLLHGNFAESFHDHPFGPLLYLVFTITALMSLYGYFKLLKFESNGKFQTPFMVTLTVTFLAFGVWRFATHDHYSFPGESIARMVADGQIKAPAAPARK